jgi:hypothetical protein
MYGCNTTHLGGGEGAPLRPAGKNVKPFLKNTKNKKN